MVCGICKLRRTRSKAKFLTCNFTGTQALCLGAFSVGGKLKFEILYIVFLTMPVKKGIIKGKRSHLIWSSGQAYFQNTNIYYGTITGFIWK